MSGARVVGAAALLAVIGVAGVGAVHAAGAVSAAAELAPARLAPFAGRVPPLGWPRQGEAAVAVQGVGMLGASPRQQPVPIASVTKIMTALVVLRDHPLAPGQGGPVLVMTATDQEVFRQDLHQDDSTLPVRVGERLSERQLLEGLLIPSGDNAAWILARWDAGAVPNFVAKMNAEARALGLRATHYADVSGLDPASTSSAVDQTHLAEVAMRDPVFAAIVRQAHVVLPFAGRLPNYNPLAGAPYVSGVKTGWTPAAGGCLVLARWARVGARPLTVVATALGQRGPAELPAAARVSDRLARRAVALLTTRVVSLARRPVGILRAPGERPDPLVVVGAARLVGWPGLPVTVHLHLSSPLPALPIPAGATVGRAVVTAGAQTVVLPIRTRRQLVAPGLLWRLL